MYIIDLLWAFVLLSFLGWLFSCIHSYVNTKKFNNKGFLNTPFCPSYGFFGVICYLLFKKLIVHGFSLNIIIVFIGSAIVLSCLTFLSGIMLEKLLGCKPWDYSASRFSFGSYISLTNSLFLGLLGTFAAYMIIPLLFSVLSLMNDTVSMIVVLSVCGVILLDAVFSVVTVIRLKKRVKKLGNLAELMEDDVPPEKVEELEHNYNMLFTDSIVRKRLVNSFPELRSTATVKQVTEKLEEIKEDNKKQYEPVYDSAEEKPFASGFCFTKLFALFLLGSFLGTCIETVFAIFAEGHFELRVGMVYGPFIPVYGGGAVLLTCVLYNMYKLSDVPIFVLSAFLGAFFEYACSWFQETVLGTVSWDYSDMPLNINGRTCLMYAFIWGFLGLVWVRYLYPFASKLIEKIPKKTGSLITAFLLIFMIYNASVTMLSIYRWNQRMNGVPPENAFETYLDRKFDDERMKLLFPHMRDSESKEEFRIKESTPDEITLNKP